MIPLILCARALSAVGDMGRGNFVGGGRGTEGELVNLEALRPASFSF